MTDHIKISQGFFSIIIKHVNDNDLIDCEMAIRSEREKSKMQEKYQMILAQMLKEEDNKYCVDCDTKRPRWTSWNLGVFICIRCAGFHRNLGVHISKVKSVNLDSWTGEQIASMQAMGNSRARAVYEANLPDGFRRPQTDSALESFIRAKYEQRKWIAKEWIPPEITLMESETHSKRIEPILTTERNEKKTPKFKPFPVPIGQENVQSPSSPKAFFTESNNPQNLLNLNDSPSHSSTQTATNTLDSLHELFTTPSDITPNISSVDQELADAFSASSNDTSKMMSTAKIMALFNTPSTSTVNIRTGSIQTSDHSSPGFTHHFSSFVPPKSLSFSNNLSQQVTNLPARSNATSTFTPEQLNTQFSQLLSFANVKTSPSTTPLTSSMSTSSGIFWQ